MPDIALITGASSGIGATFAKALSARGYETILVARRREQLAEIAAQLPTRSEIVPADLTNDSDLHRVEDCIANAAGLTLLVNNAGFGIKGFFHKADLAGQDTMHRLHVIAAMRLTHAALKAMTPRD